MKRGENYIWIANYLFLNPCITAANCRKALLLWRGYEVSDRSRGQYASYFYDRWSYKWYYKKYWSFIKQEKNKLMQLTSMGMSLIDKQLQDRMKSWDHVPRGITNINIDNPSLFSFLENRSLHEIKNYNLQKN